MSFDQNLRSELIGMLEALCEDRASAAQMARIEEIVLSSADACWTYLTYLDLHGTLYWDAGGAGTPRPLSSVEPLSKVLAELGHEQPVTTQHVNSPFVSIRFRKVAVTVAVACVLIASMLAIPKQTAIKHDSIVHVMPSEGSEFISTQETKGTTAPRSYGPPVSLTEVTPVQGEPNTATIAATETRPIEPRMPSSLMTEDEIVAMINHEIHSGWKTLGWQPSALADDSEWLRRVSLDLLGRVPTFTEAESFFENHDKHKRVKLVDQLLSDTSYARNLTTLWTNLLIGRSSNDRVNRDAFQQFLRQGFAANRPWNEVVADLIAAEGDNSQNGATNFLIAHLNNDATPATAVAARVFLGRQIQCNQCHNNPFDESKQIAFWELNSCFQQTTMVARQRHDNPPGTAAGMVTELVTKETGGPTYFETQTGLMRVAYPRFEGHDIDPNPDTNRRRKLARLMTSGAQPHLAAAFVNRMWEHFFGSGFTRRVDDMGSHQPVSHPELLELLSDQFVLSNYNVNLLVRWICLSEPYQLSSRFSESNHDDDPTLGDLPAFSRMYVKTMTAEQAYDSLLTATKVHQSGTVDWTQAEQNRQQWLQQFVVSFQTDENDEAMSFNGTIENALSLMNGPLVSKAIDESSGNFLGEIVRQKSSENEKLRSLWVAVLCRPPAPNELSIAKKMLRGSPSSQNIVSRNVEPYQDVLWALLNSNEFILVR